MNDADVGDDIGDPTLEKVLRLLAGWGVPALVTGAWVFLALTSDASVFGKVLMGVGLAIVLGLWWLIRQMMLHAALSRAIAVGNATRAIELAQQQLRGTRRASARAPYLVYVALAYELRGEWAEVTATLDAAGIDATSPAARPAWQLPATCARIGALVELGEIAAARVVLDRELAAITKRSGVTSAPSVAIGQLADARVKWAEGDLDGARVQLDRLLGDIRTNANTRALAHRYAARCATARGDDAAAARHVEQAIAAAPDTWAATGAPVPARGTSGS